MWLHEVHYRQLLSLHVHTVGQRGRLAASVLCWLSDIWVLWYQWVIPASISPSHPSLPLSPLYLPAPIASSGLDKLAVSTETEMSVPTWPTAGNTSPDSRFCSPTPASDLHLDLTSRVKKKKKFTLSGILPALWWRWAIINYSWSAHALRLCTSVCPARLHSRIWQFNVAFKDKNKSLQGSLCIFVKACRPAASWSHHFGFVAPGDSCLDSFGLRVTRCVTQLVAPKAGNSIGCITAASSGVGCSISGARHGD